MSYQKEKQKKVQILIVLCLIVLCYKMNLFKKLMRSHFIFVQSGIYIQQIQTKLLIFIPQFKMSLSVQ